MPMLTVTGKLCPDQLRNFAAWCLWRVHPLRSQSHRIVKSYYNRHPDQRCFIIGNGPSLRTMDLSLLKNEITFGMNRIYLMFDELGFRTTYYTCVNELVLEQCGDEISSLDLPRFVSWPGRRHVPGACYIRCLRHPPVIFSDDPTRGLHLGATVTYFTMQLAYYMGFTTVILIGVDHHFKSQGKPNEAIVSQGDDTDHFAAHYFGRGFRWQLPDLETSEAAYRLAKAYYERNGRTILDATVGGRLNVFPKVAYAQLFNHV